MSGRLPATCCIGCRRVDAPQLCADGCDERTIELVFGTAMDAALTERERGAHEVQTLRELLRRSVSAPLGQGQQEHRALQADARSALRGNATGPDRQAGDPADVERVIAGHCGVCGWIEAPQPCLGVCIFRAVEMVPAADYDDVRTRCEDTVRQVTRLRTVVRQLAWVTPRAGEWERTARALHALARQALDGASRS